MDRNKIPVDINKLKPPSDEYKKNYDAIFRKKKKDGKLDNE